jgi:predicted ATP-binding protein involved in virulence
LITKNHSGIKEITFSGDFLKGKDADNTWDNIPQFAVLIGPNGSGKSKILEEIYQHSIKKNSHSIIVKNKAPGSCELDIEVNIDWKIFAQDFIFIKCLSNSVKKKHYPDYTEIYKICDDKIENIIKENKEYISGVINDLISNIKKLKKTDFRKDIESQINDLSNKIEPNDTLHSEIKEYIKQSISLDELSNTRAQDFKGFNQEMELKQKI